MHDNGWLILEVMTLSSHHAKASQGPIFHYIISPIIVFTNYHFLVLPIDHCITLIGNEYTNSTTAQTLVLVVLAMPPYCRCRHRGSVVVVVERRRPRRCRRGCRHRPGGVMVVVEWRRRRRSDGGGYRRRPGGVVVERRHSRPRRRGGCRHRPGGVMVVVE